MVNVLRFRRGFRFQWEPAQQCHVLLYPEGMVKLNDSAGAILNEVDGQRSVADVVSVLEQKFPDAGALDKRRVRVPGTRPQSTLAGAVMTLSSPVATGKADVSVGPPLWLLAELTYRCPLQCPYCSNPLDFAQTEKELTTDEWVQVLRQGREMGAAQLGFSGGEPLGAPRP